MAIVNIGLGVTADLEQINNQLRAVQNVLVSNPLEVSVKSTGDMSAQLGDTQRFFTEITNGTQKVEKLKITYANLRDASGNLFQVPIRGIRELSGELGKNTKESQVWNRQLVADAQKAGYTLEGFVDATQNVGKATRDLQKEIDNLKKSTDANSKTSETFASKYQNMSGKNVDKARALTEEIKRQKTAFDAAYASGATVDDMKKIANEIDKLTDELKEADAATQAGANAFQNWGTRISNAVKQTITYAFSIKLVREAQQLLNDSIKYAIELNTEMTKIQVLQAEGAQTPEQINDLAIAFNKLGQEMGASTLEIAKGSVEWLRQGRTIQETQELTKTSMMLAKLGAMESAEATNYLTSVTNAFKISTNEAVTVVDKLIAVDNIAATSAGELATALRYTSEGASLAGVSMEQLISYIGTVSSVTRQNAEMIGQAFKTMFARMTQIQGGGTDESGLTISKVEKSLQQIGIAVRDANDSFRPMGDVLEEVAAKWDTLTDRQRADIATSIAGVRQRETFLVLMNNMDKALTYQEAQVTSLGLAQDRYGVYLDSVQAKQGQFNAKLEELKSEVVSDEMVKAFYDLALSVLELVDNLGGIVPVLTTVILLFVGLKAQAIGSAIAATSKAVIGLATGLVTQLVPGLATATVGATALNVALGPINWILMAIAAVIGVVSFAIGQHKKKIEEADQAVKDFQETLRNMPSTEVQAKTLSESIVEGQTKLEEGNATQEEVDNLYASMQKLYELAPNLDWDFNKGRPFLKMKMDVEELQEAIIKAQMEKAIDPAQLAIDMEADTKAYKENADAIQDQIDFLEIMTTAQNKYNDEVAGGASAVDDYITELNKISPDMLSIGEQSAISRLSSMQGQGYQEFGTKIVEQIQEGMDDQFSKEETNAEMVRSWTQTISSLMALGTPEADAILAQIRALAKEGGNVFAIAFAEAVGHELEDFGSRYKGQKRGEGDIVLLSQGPTPREIENANKEYREQKKLIDTIAKGLSDISKINTRNEKGQVEVGERILDLQDAINGLDIKGLTADFTYLYDAETNTWDIPALETWLDRVAEGTDLVERLREQGFDTLADSIENTANQLTNLSYNVDVLGETHTLNAQEMQQWNKWLAESLFSLGEDGSVSIQLVADDGSIIIANSVQDIDSLVEAGIISETSFAAQAAKILAEYSSTAAGIVKQNLGNILEGLPLIEMPDFGGVSGGGGGGGGGKTPEQLAAEQRIKDIEEEIEGWEKQKEALKDQIKAYKEWIDAQKESLKRQKEEADFIDELSKKNKSLAKIKARMALLALDDSEEAQAELLDLEEQAAKQEEDITETTEERKHDLKIQALEDMQEAFERALEAQIEGIDEIIERLNEEKELLQEVANGSGGGGGGGGGGGWKGNEIAVESFGDKVKKVMDAILPKFQELIDNTSLTVDNIEEMVSKWIAAGTSTDNAIARADAYLSKIKEIVDYNLTIPQWMLKELGIIAIAKHSGGLIEEHHTGDFAGKIQSNEVFAKLLKGEYVATEAQMNTFLKSTLPKIAINMSPMFKEKTIKERAGDIKIDLQVIVQGSLDKTVLPDLKESIFKEMNKMLQGRGVRRSGGSFGTLTG